MEKEITLDDLIKSGTDLKDSMYETKEQWSGYQLSNEEDYQSWKNIVIRFLADNYGGDRAVTDFETEVGKFEKYSSLNNFSKILGVLNGIKAIPQKIQKLNVKTTPEGVNINVNQIQHQSQQQAQSIQIFLEAIKDELTGKQQKELEAIVKEELPQAEKRTKIIDKVKSFGVDTLSNIIANIVTNLII